MIVHTGDYKFDNTPGHGRKTEYAKLAGFAQRGVVLLMADSTNADRAGWTQSEAVIDGALDKVFRAAKRADHGRHFRLARVSCAAGGQRSAQPQTKSLHNRLHHVRNTPRSRASSVTSMSMTTCWSASGRRRRCRRTRSYSWSPVHRGSRRRCWASWRRDVIANWMCATAIR